MNKILKHIKKDKGDSSLVTIILIIPLIVVILISIVDVSLFFNDKSQLDAVARDGARTVAIVGGTGNSKIVESRLGEYGLLTSCETARENNVKGIRDSSSAIECNVALGLHNNTRLTNADVKDIYCYVDGNNKTLSTRIGETTKCVISWKWNGVPGSILNINTDILNSKDKQVNNDRNLEKNLKRSVGSAEAEVRGER